MRKITILSLLLLIVIQNNVLLASGTFQFFSARDGGVPNPDAEVIAVMQLSGASPYDHTDVVSLSFTPEADALIGLMGEYVGEFDETVGLNRVIESSDNYLSSTSNDPMNLGTLFRDLSNSIRPISDLPFGFELNPQSNLTLSFFDSSSPFSYITKGPNGPSLIGQWIRAVPEPSALTMLAFGGIAFPKRTRRS